MGQPAARTDDHGIHDGWVGIITGGSADTNIGGKPAASAGMLYYCGHEDHAGYYELTDNGASSELNVNGRKAARVGTRAACGAIITEGCATVLV